MWSVYSRQRAHRPPRGGRRRPRVGSGRRGRPPRGRRGHLPQGVSGPRNPGADAALPPRAGAPSVREGVDGRAASEFGGSVGGRRGDRPDGDRRRGRVVRRRGDAPVEQRRRRRPGHGRPPAHCRVPGRLVAADPAVPRGRRGGEAPARGGARPRSGAARVRERRPVRRDARRGPDIAVGLRRRLLRRPRGRTHAPGVAPRLGGARRPSPDRTDRGDARVSGVMSGL